MDPGQVEMRKARRGQWQWKKASTWRSPDGVSQIRSSRCSTARRRSRSRGSASLGRYQSPWMHLNMAGVQNVLLDLEKLTDVPPYSFAEFEDSLLGAAEHARTSSRSVSHYLSTMGRASTAMIRTRNEGEPWEHILDSVMECARRICSKSHAGTRDAIQEKVYKFLRNRIDAAAMDLMSEIALNESMTSWGLFSAIERRVTLSILRDLHQDLEINNDNMLVYLHGNAWKCTTSS
jgi:hypothetical protein